MDLEKRLQLAQVINLLLKSEYVIKWPKGVGDELCIKEVEESVKKHLHNTLFEIMGEPVADAFTQEEKAILKSMVVKIKQGVKA